MIVRKELICERKRFFEDYISPVSTGHYETIQVVDSAATASAREACRSGWQATIDNLNNELKNCNTQINKLNSLSSEIDEKKAIINDLKQEFNSVQSTINNAHINYNITDGNINCMVRIGTELTQMKTNCNKELKTWQTKRNETRTALKDARLQKAECGHIVKYKTITVYVA